MMMKITIFPKLDNFLLSPCKKEKLDDGTTATESLTETSHGNQLAVAVDSDDPFEYNSSVSQSNWLDDTSERVWFDSLSDRFNQFYVEETSGDIIETVSESPNATNVLIELVTSSKSSAPGLEGEKQEAKEDIGSDFTASSEEEGKEKREQQYFNDLKPEFEDECDEHCVRKKRVHFDLTCNEYSKAPTPPITDEEKDEYWYESEMLRIFKDNASIAVNSRFLKRSERVDCFQRAFQFCKGQDLQGLDRHRLKLSQLYEKEEHLVGLEHQILFAIRGDPRKLRRFVLGPKILRSSSDSSSSSSRPANSKRRSRHAPVLAHYSKCVSQPSLLMAHQMALALAATVREDP